jgi:hypothetical protein
MVSSCAAHNNVLVSMGRLNRVRFNPVTPPSLTASTWRPCRKEVLKMLFRRLAELVFMPVQLMWLHRAMPSAVDLVR